MFFFFSRRFMKCNATFIVTLFFLSTQTDQNSSQKFYKILWCQIAPFGLANWTKMVLPVLTPNIPYRARPKSPTFQFFFGTARHFFRIFFRNFFPSKGSPAFFCCFATEWMLENPKGFPLSVFFGIVRFWWSIFGSNFRVSEKRDRKWIEGFEIEFSGFARFLLL